MSAYLVYKLFQETLTPLMFLYMVRTMRYSSIICRLKKCVKWFETPHGRYQICGIYADSKVSTTRYLVSSVLAASLQAVFGSWKTEATATVPEELDVPGIFVTPAIQDCFQGCSIKMPSQIDGCGK